MKEQVEPPASLLTEHDCPDRHLPDNRATEKFQDGIYWFYDRHEHKKSAIITGSNPFRVQYSRPIDKSGQMAIQ